MLTNESVAQMVSDKDNIKVMQSLFEAVAYQETIRSIIEPLQQEIVDKYKFKTSQEWVDKRASVNEDFTERVVITTPKHMYLADDDDFNIYLKELERGYERVKCLPKKKGNCPLLEAESFVRDVKREVADYFEPYTGMNYNQISYSLESYKKYFDLLMQLFAPKIKAI